MRKKYPFYVRFGAMLLNQTHLLYPQEFPEKEQPAQQLNPQKIIPPSDPKTPDPTTQSAIVWISVEDSLPKYYEPVKIRIGNDVMDKEWARLSGDDNKDFYAVAGDPKDDNRVIDHITHWGWTVTPDNIDKVIRLKVLLNLIESNYIPYGEVIEFNKEKTEGFNHGIGRAAEIIETEIHRLRKPTSQSAKI